MYRAGSAAAVGGIVALVDGRVNSANPRTVDVRISPKMYVPVPAPEIPALAHRTRPARLGPTPQSCIICEDEVADRSHETSRDRPRRRRTRWSPLQAGLRAIPSSSGLGVYARAAFRSRRGSLNSFRISRSSPSMMTSVPAHWPNSTRSPILTPSGRRFPLSSVNPGPT
jgi:hypothetical protein